MNIKFKFDERRDTKDYIESTTKIDIKNIRSAIWYAANYFTHISPTDYIFDAIIDYLSARCPQFHYEGYVYDIDKCIRKAEKYKFKFVGDIYITQHEMDIIQSFEDLRHQKITFVLVALAKYFNAIYETNNNYIYAPVRDIFSLARVTLPADYRDYFFSFAYQNKIIKPNFSIGSNLYIVDIVNEQSPKVLELNEGDYKTLAYAYLNCVRGGYKRCGACGGWFRLKKTTPNQKYCTTCLKTNDATVFKHKICIDCGKDFYIPVKNNRSIRCDDCQLLYDSDRKKKWYQAQKQEI